MSAPLSALELAALRDLAAGALRLTTRWAADGGRRMRIFYSRQAPPAGEHDGATLIALGGRGLLRTADEHDGFEIEERLRLARAL